MASTKEWTLHFYFFHRKCPFHIQEKVQSNIPPFVYPSSHFKKTENLKGCYQRVSANNIKGLVNYVFTYEECEPSLKDASGANLEDDFPVIHPYRLEVKPESLLLDKMAFLPLLHTGAYIVVYLSSSEDTDSLTLGEMQKRKIAVLHESYEVTEDKVSRTKQFTEMLKAELPQEYQVFEQNHVTFYCEYKAKVYLAIRKEFSLYIDLESLVDEYKRDEESGTATARALAGMLAMASLTTVHCLTFCPVNIIHSVKVFGVVASGTGQAEYLEMDIQLENGTTTIFKSEPVDLLDAFNYALGKL